MTSATLPEPGFEPLFDYERLMRIAREQAADYQQASPFPHIVIDNFIPAELVERILAVFPDLKARKGQTPDAVVLDDGTSPQPHKRWLSNQIGVDMLLKQVYWEMNSADFLRFLEKLTGIEQLIPDPHLNGAGVHDTKKDGLLMIHADFNKHPLFNLDRRINILIYLNQDWPDEYGGHLELWARDMSKMEQRVAPLAGRCVIFSTLRDSFHGHPHPLSCPPDRSRKSIALYYYTKGRPADQDPTPHPTLWKKLPDQEA